MTEPTKMPHEWSREALLPKTERYAALMLKQDRESPQFALLSTFTLELLIRTTFGNISPVLLADYKDWNNIYYSLGRSLNQKISGKSVSISDLINKAQIIFQGTFTREMANFSVLHIERRNAELHGGLLPFDKLPSSDWLPEFYSTCQALLKTLDLNLVDLFGLEEEKLAKAIIANLNDETSKSVRKLIAAHQTIWEAKGTVAQKKLIIQAELIATRHLGHRSNCPACKCLGLVHGSPAAPPNVELKDDTIIERTSMLPSNFECSACELKISGFSKLKVCGLGGSFTQTSRTDAAEYFGMSVKDSDWPGHEEDNNEP